jgi:hypothetical protein
LAYLLGYLLRIDYDDNFLAKYIVSLLIKMENDGGSDPDFYLRFDSHFYSYFKNEIMNLNRGDFLAFNATIINEGNPRSAPIFEGFGLSKLNDHITVSPHIHSTGKL